MYDTIAAKSNPSKSMPKNLLLTLFLTLICLIAGLIFVPKGQILASGGPSEPETTQYLPGGEAVNKFLIGIPLGVANYFKHALSIPTTKEEWQGKYRETKEAFSDFGQYLKDLKIPDFIKNIFSETYQYIRGFIKEISGK